jgi:hypothetical protein
VKLVDAKTYKEDVDAATAFLRGKDRTVVKDRLEEAASPQLSGKRPMKSIFPS